MLVLVSGAARVLGSKFVDDLPLKADLGTSRSHLWIQVADTVDLFAPSYELFVFHS